MKALIFTLLACMIVGQGEAQQEQFVSALRENTRALDMSSGDAADLLESAIANSQFTLIGEAHGLAEVQSVSEQLYRIGGEHGYKTMVIETDPFCAAKVAQLAQADESETNDFAEKYPMAIPFFHSEEGDGDGEIDRR